MNIRKSSTILLVVLFSLSLIGCGSGSNNGGGIPINSVSEIIGSQGGTIEIAGAQEETLTIEIPESALTTEIDISVSLVDDPNGIPSADSLFPKVILGPEGIVFEKPIYLTFQITDEILQEAGITSLDEVADYLNVYYWDESNQTWEPLAITEVDSNTNIVIAETDHFSIFEMVLDWYKIDRVSLLGAVKQGESFQVELSGSSRSFNGVDTLWAGLGDTFSTAVEMLFAPLFQTDEKFAVEAPNQIGFKDLVICGPWPKVLWKQQIVVDYETDVFRSDNYYINLINDYCPVLVFGKWDIDSWNMSFPYGEELYLPTRMEDMLESAVLMVDTSRKISPSIADLAEMSDSRYVLDFKGNEKIGIGMDKVIYATAVEDGDYIYLQYWFFYPFDAKSGNIILCLEDCGFDFGCRSECFWNNLKSLQFLTSHYGDFESITVVLKNNGSGIKEEWVVYGQHLPEQRMEYLPEEGSPLPWIGDGVRVPWDNVKKDGFHPYAYVALGSHGCFPREGLYVVHPKFLGFEFDYEERAGGGEEWHPGDYDIEYLPRMSYLDPNSPQWESKKFLLFSGQWGYKFLGNLLGLSDIRLMNHSEDSDPNHNHKWFVVDWVNGLEEVSFGDIEPPENISPVAEITLPLADANFIEGNEIAFNGSGTDAEDGALSGDSLVWTSDKDGEIGRGASFNANDLSVGSHTITLTVTDSEGAADTEIITISVASKVAEINPQIAVLTELSRPTALAIDSSNDNLYCVFYGAPALTTINTITGERSLGVPMSSPPATPLVNDIDVSYDDRYLYISNSITGYPQVIIMDYAEKKVDTINGMESPTGVAVDYKLRHLYVTDIGSHSIYDIDLDSSEISVLAGSGTAGYFDGVGTEAKFDTPVGITINPSNTKLYVAEPNNNRVREIDIVSKNVITLAGSGVKETKDGIGTNASFDDPAYITINRAGTKLYVVEYDGATVREINIVTKKVSTLIDRAAGLKDPRDIVITHDDSILYLADYGNDRVLRMSLKMPDPNDKTPPSVPIGLTLGDVLSKEIKLSWDKSTDNIGVAYYKIFRDSAYLKSVRASFISDSKLESSTQYCYTISACDEAGNESGQSSQICATTLLPEMGIAGTLYYSTTPLVGIKLALRQDMTFVDIPGTEVFSDENGNYKILYNIPGEYDVHVYLPSEYVTTWGKPFPWTISEGKLATGTGRDLYLAKYLTLVSPLDKAIISETTPTFIWEENPEAFWYDFRIYSMPLRELVFQKNVSGTTYTLSESLLSGEYQWFIIGIDTQREVVAQGELRFTISP